MSLYSFAEFAVFPCGPASAKPFFACKVLLTFATFCETGTLPDHGM